MTQIPFADNFLAGSLLTILMPVLLLVAIAVWYVVVFRRVPKEASDSAPATPATPTRDAVGATSATASRSAPAGPSAPTPASPETETEGS